MPIIRLPVPGEVPVAMLSTTEFPEPAGDSAVIGVSTYAARADHVHPKQEIDISDKLGISNPQPPGTASPGVSLLAAREDHVHPGQNLELSDINPQPPGTANSGTSEEISRADHIHPRQLISEDIVSALTKTTTVFDDFLPLIDSQDGNSLKKVKIINSIRQKLYSNLNLYVRKDGNDNNTGVSNTSGGAFLTIQKAIDVSHYYDNAGFNITINVGAGTYNEALYFPHGIVGRGKLLLIGDRTTPSNVQIRSTVNSATITIDTFARVTLMGFLVANDGSGSGIFVNNLSFADIMDINFGPAVGAHHLLVRGFLTILGNYSITAGAYRHFCVDNSGQLTCNGGTITLIGISNFAGQFAFADINGSITFQGTTFSGSATGQKYYVQGGGVIQTYTGNVNIFPGNVAGSVGTGGYYG